MKHLGDITKINGAEVEPVNVIIGGSPCQDLSVAGKRAGLSGERSCLFMEQIRIIKEMRNTDVKRGRTGKDIRPRYMVWENVPGAFSSNKGADFGAVLLETIKVVCEKAPVVPIPKNGWPTAGCLTDVGGNGVLLGEFSMHSFGECPSAAVESHLSQILEECPHQKYCLSARACEGIIRRAQRRGKQLPEILKQALEKQAQWGGLSNNTFCLQGNGIDRSDDAGCNGKGWTNDVSYTLNTMDRHAIATVTTEDTSQSNSIVAGFKADHTFGVNYEEDRAPTLVAGNADASVVYAVENHPNDSRVKLSDDNVVQTLSGRMGTGGGNVPLLMQEHTQM